MNSGLHFISNKAKIDSEIIKSMHRLRYSVFYVERGWRDGLIIENGLETDIYDTENAHYIVKIDTNKEVIAACRLISTVQNYMLKEKFSDVVKGYSLPCDENIWEITRVCMNKNHRQKEVLLEIMAAILSFGLSNNFKNFISYTTTDFIKIIRNCGWNPVEIKGNNINEGDSKVLLYPVDINTRTKIFNKLRIKSLEFLRISDYHQKINFIYR